MDDTSPEWSEDTRRVWDNVNDALKAASLSVGSIHDVTD
jgi:hypothetical protein